MKRRVRLILLAGFGTLVALIGILGYGAYRRAEQIYLDVSSIHETYRQSAAALGELHTDMYLSGMLVRDYLLDRDPSAGTAYRKELLGMRVSMANHLSGLGLTQGVEDVGAFARLRQEVDTYWDALDPIFEWTPEEKAALSLSFLRKQVLPRRQAVLSISDEIDRLNTAGFQLEQAKIGKSRDELRHYLGNMFVVTLSLALVVAGLSFFFISRLEQSSEAERRRAEQAEQELRRLSQKLVRTQEEERKFISRELHDEIGQMLTGLRMDLARLEALRSGPEEEFLRHAAQMKSMAEETLQSVRNLAMGLRPSMLDDLGLVPALQWQAREFSRRTTIPVTVQTDGKLDELPEPLRTCTYRLVQESLTNCARHAQATAVRIMIHGSEDRLSMSIEDDGVGFDAGDAAGRGLGLVGMEERVRELGGSLAISTQPQKGTLLEVQLPFNREALP